MKILIIHNLYRFSGGEDAVAEDEANLLRERGHEVVTLTKTNVDIKTTASLRLGLQTVWSKTSFDEVRSICQRYKPDVVHAHNTFPLVSPSSYWAAVGENVPVIQTLHNFRLLCANALLLRDGRPCEDCIGHLPWRGIIHKCYRNSYRQSLALVTMLGVNRLIGSYQKKVRRYIALNEYCKQKFIAGGLPANRIAVKSNFSTDPQQILQSGKGLLFVGRLSEEKGLAVLIEAANQARQHVTVVGDGPLVERARQCSWLNLKGHCSREQVLELMAQSRALIVPSLWYENMPRTIIEAYSCGLPVIASDIGALKEMVPASTTGWRFPAGDAAALAERLGHVASLGVDEILAFKQRAKAEYFSKYTAESNYKTLMAIYAEAIAEEAAAQ